jgi:D-alanyl-D-alanine carboxypeptidase
MGRGGLRRALFVVVVSTLLLSACSSDDGSAAPSSNSRAETSTSSVVVSDRGEGIEHLVSEHAPDGVDALFVGVVDDTTAMSAAAGLDGDGNLVDVGTPWETASLVKMVVAVAVLQLVDQGLVDLDAPVATYVDFPVAESISVRDVLSHRGGIANISDHLSSCPAESTLDDMKGVAGAATAPTVSTEYSNANFLLLGYLVGYVTGQDVGEYARTNIFDQVGMTSTYWWESQEGPPVYWRSPVSDPGPVSPFSCPGLDVTVGLEGLTFVSTLSDLDVFLRALFEGDLITDSSLNEMLPSEGDDDGLGIWAESDDVRGVTLYGHFGSRSGFATVAYYDPERHRSIVLFGHEPIDVEDLMWEAWDAAEQHAG